MDVQIVNFPETLVAAVEHVGPPQLEHQTARRLIDWKLERRLLDPAKYRHYGVHFTDPQTTDPAMHRVLFCLSVDFRVEANPSGIVSSIIPANRCALARDIGSRNNNRAASYLVDRWLPASGERLGAFPVFFHYVNVGPHIAAEDMITDVYLPLE